MSANRCRGAVAAIIRFMPLGRFLCQSWPALALFLLIAVGSARADDALLAASGSGHAWYIVAPPGKRPLLCHHAAAMNGAHFGRAMSISRLPEAIAAAPGDAARVWIVHEPTSSGEGDEPLRREVFTLAAERDPATGLFRTVPADRLTIVEPLPATDRLAGFQGTNSGPVALLVSDHALRGEPNTARLLQLRGDRWIDIQLPELFSVGEHVHLGVDGADGGRLHLLTSIDAQRTALYRSVDGGSWDRFVIELPAAKVRSLVNHQGRLVAVLVSNPGETSRTVEITYIRPHAEGGGLVQIAQVPVGSDPWAVIAMSNGLRLLTASSAADMVTMRQIDPISGVVGEAMLMREQPIATGRLWHMALMLSVAVLSVLVVIFVRPGTRGEIKLPASVVPMPATARLLAMAVDLFPGGLAAVLILKVSPADLLRMPIAADSIEAAAPYLIMAAFAICHCTVTELVKGTTLGKALFGGRIVCEDGSPVRFQQVIWRNLLKVMILLVPPLAIFALLSPQMQGFNDLLARTVVVRDRDQP